MCYGSIEYLILSTLYQFCLQIKSLVYGILVPTKGNFKMASFLVFFEVSGPAVAVHSQKSGYLSVEAPYLDLSCYFW